MYDHIKRYPWVLPVVPYKVQKALIARLDDLVIAPAEAKVKEIRGNLAASGNELGQAGRADQR